MTNLFIIENRISSVQKYLTILEGYKVHSRERIEGDVTLMGAIERYLYLVMQSSIDLADALIAYKKLRKPATLAEAFLVLEENGLISNELAKKMVKMAGLRNIIAHEYASLDYAILYQVLQEKLTDIAEFVKVVGRALK